MVETFGKVFRVDTDSFGEIDTMKRELDAVKKFGEESTQESRDKRAAQHPDPKPTGFQMAQDAERQFSANPDAKAAITQVMPQFDAAMKQSNEDTRTIARIVSRGAMASGADYASAQSGSAIARWLLSQSMTVVDPQDREFVQDKVNAYHNAEMQSTRENVVKELSRKYPGVGKALQNEEQANTTLATAEKKDKAVWAPLEAVVNQQIDTQEIVASALRKAGQTAEADAIHDQGLSVFTGMMTVEGRYEAGVKARAEMMYQQFIAQIQERLHPQAPQQPGRGA